MGTWPVPDCPKWTNRCRRLGRELALETWNAGVDKGGTLAAVGNKSAHGVLPRSWPRHRRYRGYKVSLLLQLGQGTSASGRLH